MSLKRIVLFDFVIVSTLDLAFDTGFTVLTGETGAGKSILIDALQLVTGGRADPGMIREGASRTDVSAEFDTPPDMAPWLEAAGFDAETGLLLRRSVDTQGKSRAWINGSPATAGQLRAVGEQLLDIHGQHAWQSLTRTESVRGLLDAYAQVSTLQVAILWQHWRTAQDRLAQAHAAQDVQQQQRDRLSWQISELEKLSPRPDEWPTLNAEHTRLSHAQSLLEAAQAALVLLDEEDNNAAGRIGSACDVLQKQASIEPAFQALTEVLSSSLAQLEDTVRTLRAYLRHTELDPAGLAALDERMGLWVSLARRYKCAPEDLAQVLLDWRQDLQALDSAADLQALAQAQEAAAQAYAQEAQRLTHVRRHAGVALATTISAAMQGLGMQGGQFEVQLTPSAQPTPSGQDDVSFLVAGHAGSTPRPVNKVASGGELSRIALAIAVTTSQLGTAQTLIFDEVDAGVGGAVAETVGRLMHQLGQDRQVLAVTHLPQVAACADWHLVVRKERVGSATQSSVASVQSQDRVAELARMLGGERILPSTLAHARDLLEIQGA